MIDAHRLLADASRAAIPSPPRRRWSTDLRRARSRCARRYPPAADAQSSQPPRLGRGPDDDRLGDRRRTRRRAGRGAARPRGRPLRRFGEAGQARQRLRREPLGERVVRLVQRRVQRARRRVGAAALLQYAARLGIDLDGGHHVGDGQLVGRPRQHVAAGAAGGGVARCRRARGRPAPARPRSSGASMAAAIGWRFTRCAVVARDLDRRADGVVGAARERRAHAPTLKRAPDAQNGGAMFVDSGRPLMLERAGRWVSAGL